MWAVRYHPAAQAEEGALPPSEQLAMTNVVMKLRTLGPMLPFPHQSAVRGTNLRELRPRSGRSAWRALYRRVGDVFVIGAISPEAAFGFAIVFVPITLALLGGTGTILGPVVGGAIYIYLQNYGIASLQDLVPGLIYFPNAITGFILIFVGLLMPKGIVGSPRVRSFFRRIQLEITK